MNETIGQCDGAGTLQPAEVGLSRFQGKLTLELEELDKRIAELTEALYELRVDDYSPEENVQAKEPLPPMSPAMDRVQGHISTVRAMQYRIDVLLSTLRV